jgi:hypothetical protein
MSAWTADELATIGATADFEVAPVRSDGTSRPRTTIWVVRVGDELFVRSFRGPNGAWYRAAQRSHRGRIRAGAVERDVAFEDVHDNTDAVDAAYPAKYGRSSYVDAMVTPDAAATTLRLIAAHMKGERSDE